MEEEVVGVVAVERRGKKRGYIILCDEAKFTQPTQGMGYIAPDA